MTDNENLDLSHLLNEQRVPQDGAALARRTAIHRRHRKQAIASGLGALLLVGIGALAAVNVGNNSEDEVILKSDAKSTNTTLETTSTTAPTTTTSADPRASYVGLVHNFQGQGIPLNVKIRSYGGSVSGTEFAKGDTGYFIVEDKKGTMLWIETVTEDVDLGSGEGDTKFKVQKIVDIPAIPKNSDVCISWCALNNKQQDNSIGYYDMNTSKFSYVARINPTKGTVTSTSTKGWKPFPEDTQQQPAPSSIPARPELYKQLATMSQEDREWVGANEQVVIGGGGNTLTNLSYTQIRDNKENKSVFIIERDGRKEMVITDASANGDFTFIPTGISPDLATGFTYKGKNTPGLLIYTIDDPQTNEAPIIKRAWLVNDSGVSFTEVDIKDVKTTLPN